MSSMSPSRQDTALVNLVNIAPSDTKTAKTPIGFSVGLLVNQLRCGKSNDQNKNEEERGHSF